MSPQPRAYHHCGRVVNCQEHYLRCGRNSPDFLGGFDAVHFRHVDVQHDYIRLQLDNSFDGFFAVLGFAPHLKPVPIEKFTNGRSGRHMVVHDKDFGGQFSLQLGICAPAGAGSTWRRLYFQCLFICSIRESPDVPTRQLAISHLLFVQTLIPFSHGRILVAVECRSTKVSPLSCRQVCWRISNLASPGRLSHRPATPCPEVMCQDRPKSS